MGFTPKPDASCPSAASQAQNPLSSIIPEGASQQQRDSGSHWMIAHLWHREKCLAAQTQAEERAGGQAVLIQAIPSHRALQAGLGGEGSSSAVPASSLCHTVGFIHFLLTGRVWGCRRDPHKPLWLFCGHHH